MERRTEIETGIDRLKYAEKRISDRKKLIVDVHYEGGDTTGIANTRDISLGGLFLRTNTDFVRGAELIMNLTIGGKGVSIEGVVAYLDNEHGVGVEFKNLSAHAEELLKTELANE